MTDIHATVLNQLGLDARRLEVPGQQADRDRLRQADRRDPGLTGRFDARGASAEDRVAAAPRP